MDEILIENFQGLFFSFFSFPFFFVFPLKKDFHLKAHTEIQNIMLVFSSLSASDV